jgi:hypothetical protein
MPRVKIGPAVPDRDKLHAEIARLRDLDVGQLRSRWHTAFGRPAPAHLARHLLFRSLAYRLQADRLGDLDRESQRLLDRIIFRSYLKLGSLNLLMAEITTASSLRSARRYAPRGAAGIRRIRLDGRAMS